MTSTSSKNASTGGPSAAAAAMPAAKSPARDGGVDLRPGDGRGAPRARSRPAPSQASGRAASRRRRRGRRGGSCGRTRCRPWRTRPSRPRPRAPGRGGRPRRCPRARTRGRRGRTPPGRRGALRAARSRSPRRRTGSSFTAAFWPVRSSRSRATSAFTSISSPASTASRQSPIAARRRPNGSREPVGRFPSAKATARLSILSAAARTRPASVWGSGAVGGVGQVLLLDGHADRLGESREPRVLGADVALEVGELADELRGLVGLREPRRLPAMPLRRRGPRRAPSSRSVLSANVPAPATNVIDAELPGQRLDAHRDVALERERRVLEPPVEHALVPGGRPARDRRRWRRTRTGCRRAGSSAGATASRS